ncbi:MAG: hypothetical protein HY074_10100 [Deltaproteobacteria bacterium]|nr:hypothetical protein [Deltaproteobacteria bacterium]
MAAFFVILSLNRLARQKSTASFAQAWDALLEGKTPPPGIMRLVGQR